MIFQPSIIKAVGAKAGGFSHFPRSSSAVSGSRHLSVNVGRPTAIDPASPVPNPNKFGFFHPYRELAQHLPITPRMSHLEWPIEAKGSYPDAHRCLHQTGAGLGPDPCPSRH